MYSRILAAGVYFWRIRRERDRNEVRGLGECVIGCSLGNDGEAYVAESADVESEDQED